MSSIVWSDIFKGEAQFPLTRGEAMAIPAVSKALGVISAAIIQSPLRALNADGELAPQPAWLTRTDGLYPPQWRAVKTFEDLALDGASLWLVERGSDNTLIKADRCAPDRWTLTDGTVLVDEIEVGPSGYLYIPSFRPGLLDIAQRTLSGAIDTETAWTGRMRNPVPMTELHMTDDSDLTPDEAQTVVSNWVAARHTLDGVVGFTPKGIEVRVHGDLKADLFTEGRNAVRSDIGSFFGIPAGEMDASLAEASLTYSTTEGNRSKFIEQCLPLWMGPIESFLSMDNVVPRGTRVRFDTSDITNTVSVPTGTPVED